MKTSVYKAIALLFLFTGLICSTSAQEKGQYKEQEKQMKAEQLLLERELREIEREAREAHSESIKSAGKADYYFQRGDGILFYGHQTGKSSQLSLSKSFDDESVKNENTFDVDKSVQSINFSISGSVEKGKIIISITLPDGEKLKEMTLDSSADIQFSQMIRPSKDDSKYGGKWTYTIEAVEATGHYRLSIQTR
ncbi:MAG: hypothetical protein K9G38_05570 [Bacteroidales bacterium]|nr:hypothetical protein [Bacteroidales bacterium]